MNVNSATPSGVTSSALTRFNPMSAAERDARDAISHRTSDALELLKGRELQAQRVCRDGHTFMWPELDTRKCSSCHGHGAFIPFATTTGIAFSFFSSGYKDVSVHQVVSCLPMD